MRTSQYLISAFLIVFSVACHKEKERPAATPVVIPPVIISPYPYTDTFQGTMSVHHGISNNIGPPQDFDTTFSSESYVQHLGSSSLVVSYAYWDRAYRMP